MEDKPLPPTQRKLMRAWARGEGPFSSLLVRAVELGGYYVALSCLGSHLWSYCQQMLRAGLQGEVVSMMPLLILVALIVGMGWLSAWGVSLWQRRGYMGWLRASADRRTVGARLGWLGMQGAIVVVPLVAALSWIPTSWEEVGPILWWVSGGIIGGGIVLGIFDYVLAYQRFYREQAMEPHEAKEEEREGRVGFKK